MNHGIQTAYGSEVSPAFGSSDFQTCKNNGATVIGFNGMSYATFLPNAITSPSQVSSSLFASTDQYASWAEQYGVYVIFTFAALSDKYWGAPSWMTSLATGSGYGGAGTKSQLEYEYFSGQSEVSSVATSITCLWEAFASRYSGNPYVIFDFFNEPMYALNNNGMTSSNYETLDADYAGIVQGLVNAVHSINSNQICLVQAPFTVYFYLNYGGTPNHITNAIRNCHAYVNPSIPLATAWNSWETYYINGYVTLYHTDLGEQLFIGEYGYVDTNQYELTNFTDSNGLNWQQILSGQVAYLQTLPLWGYQWNSYPWLYGQQYNTQYGNEGYGVYSQNNSNWIISVTLAGPLISLNPASGVIGSTIAVSGSGFAASSSLTAKFDSTIVWTGTSTSNGAVPSGATFNVPAGSSVGSHTITVTDASNNSATATFTITTVATISLSLTTGPIGTAVTITGSGFANSSALTAKWGTINVWTGTSTSSGALTSGATFTAPSASADSYTVTVTDASNNSASAMFTLTAPSISLSPLSGPVGTTVIVSGSGFLGSSSLTAKWVSTTEWTGTATSSGAVPSGATFTVPSGNAAGIYAVSVSDASGNTATVNFMIGATISLSPTSGTVGTTVTVTGSGFTANATLTITFGGVTVKTTTATATGTIPSNTTVQVPAGTVDGTYTVTVVD